MDKVSQAIWDCLVELYANSTPSADFNKLVEEAPVNEEGQKVVDFMSYEIDHNKMQEIVDKHENMLKKKRVNELHLKSFRFNIYLGCSPKSKREITN